MGLKEIIKKNNIFILLAMIAIFCFMKKDNYLPLQIISDVDSYVTFSSTQGVLEQTWLSEAKEISQVQISCVPENDFEDEIVMKVLEAENRTIVASTVGHVEFNEGVKQDIQFQFQPFKVKAGEQYIFQISFGDQKKDNRINVRSGSNYMGCTIGEEAQNQGLDLVITYVKNSRIFWLFISFLPFIGLSFLFIMLWGRNWEEAVGMSITGTIFTLYVFGLFGKLELGIYAVYLLALLGLVWGIVIYNKKETKLKELLSPGMFIFVCAVVLILLNCNSARLARWDEFSHWGLAVKDMFYSNSFAKHFDSTVTLKYYPPAATLIEYFFCYTNELYTDKMAYMGFQVFSLGLLLAGVGACRGKKSGKIVAVSLMLLLLPTVFFGDVYNSLYVDPLLAFGVAYVLICYYTMPVNVFNGLRIALGLFSLTMMKDTGVVLAGLLTLVMLGNELFKCYKNRTVKMKGIVFSIACTLGVCAIFFVWQFYLSIPVEHNSVKSDSIVQIDTEVMQGEEEQLGIRATGEEARITVEGMYDVVTTSKEVQGVEKAREETTEEQAETMKVTGAIGASGLSLEGIIELCKGNAPEYKYKVIETYVEKMCSENVYVFGDVSFSYLDLSVAVLVLMLMCSQVRLFKHEEDKFISFGVLTFLAGAGYCVFMLVMYLFAFSQSDALILTSYVRYLGSYICGMVIAAGVIIISSANEKEKMTHRLLIMGLCGFIMIVAPFEKFIIKNMDTEVTDEQAYGYGQLAEILKTGAKRGDSVYYVCNNSDGYSNLQFKNAIVPINSSLHTNNIFGAEESYFLQREIYNNLGIEEKGTPLYVTADEWKNVLGAYQYVVIFHANDVFKAAYESVFEEPETIDNGTVYLVENSNDGIMLRYIGKTGIKSFR